MYIQQSNGALKIVRKITITNVIFGQYAKWFPLFLILRGFGIHLYFFLSHRYPA